MEVYQIVMVLGEDEIGFARGVGLSPCEEVVKAVGTQGVFVKKVLNECPIAEK